MTMKKISSTKSLFLRVLGFLAAGLLIAFILITSTNTYSLFTKSLKEQMHVTSASAENLITNVDIIEQQDGSQLIEITRDSEYGYRPEVGFAIEGDISNYILHINPVLIDVNGVYQIPLEPNLNANQFLELLRLKFLKHESSIQGTVTVKNFDGKIIASKEIEISIDYLLSRIDEDIVRSKPNHIEELKIDDAIANITNLIVALAGQINWEEQSANNNKSEKSSNISLSLFQKDIINNVSPSLISKIDELYIELELLDKEKAELKLQNEKIVSQNLEQLNSLNHTIEQLEIENEKLRKLLEKQENPEPEVPEPIVPNTPDGETSILESAEHEETEVQSTD